MRQVVLFVALSMFVSMGALADKKDKDHRHRGNGHGPKIEIHDNGKNYKYEYKDRGCKYEYHFNYRTGEEKIEQKGNCRGVSPHRAVYRTDDVPVVRVPDRHDYPRGSDHEHVPSGSRLACNREVIGRLLGGVIGGIAGSQIGSGSGRQAATVVGAIAGVLIGGKIGERMDRADSACAYQAFEFAQDRETVFWTNPTSQIEYELTPLRLVSGKTGGQCREYQAVALASGKSTSTQGLACRQADGMWDVKLR